MLKKAVKELIKHYEGPLGVFDYDTEKFLIKEIVSYGSKWGEHLVYIGNETDGSVINIPNGIKDASFMFNNVDLISAPLIPAGVEKCSSMFAGTGLITGPLIPDSVEACNCMFDNCKKLKIPSVIPFKVKDCHAMYSGCSSLEYAPVIPRSVEDTNSMFFGCTAKVRDEGKWMMEHRGKTPDSFIHYKGELGEFDYSVNEFELVLIKDLNKKCFRYIGKETDGGKIDIPDGLVDTSFMFYNNKDLVYPADIPDSVKIQDAMYMGCSSLSKPSEIKTGVESCKATYAYCSAMTDIPVIPTTVRSIDKIVEGCSDNVQTKFHDKYLSSSDKRGELILSPEDVKLIRGLCIDEERQNAENK